eukprot:8112213-Pyramimonas_sp.AAC.1
MPADGERQPPPIAPGGDGRDETFAVMTAREAEGSTAGAAASGSTVVAATTTIDQETLTRAIQSAVQET